MVKMYGLNNMYTLWQNSPNLNDFERTSSIDDFGFSVVRMWYAVAKKLPTKDAWALRFSRHAKVRFHRLQTCFKVNFLLTNGSGLKCTRMRF